MQQEKHSSVSLNGQAMKQRIHLSLKAANPSKLQEMLDYFEHRVGSKKTWLNLKTQNVPDPDLQQAQSSNLQSFTAWIFRD